MLPLVGMATRAQEKPTPRKRAAHLGPERRRPEVLDAALKLFLTGKLKLEGDVMLASRLTGFFRIPSAG